MKKLVKYLWVAGLAATPLTVVSCDPAGGDRIIVTIPNNSTAYNKILANSILAEIKTAGYTGKALYVNEDTAQEQSQLSTELGMGGVLGVVAVPIDVAQSEQAYKEAVDNDVPVIAVDRTINNKSLLIGETATDNAGGGAVGAQHIADIVTGSAAFNSDTATKNASVKAFYDKVVSGEQTSLDIIEMIGDTTNSSSVGRHQGFIQLLDTTGAIGNTARTKTTYSWSQLAAMNGLLYQALNKIENASTKFGSFTVNYASSVYNWDEAVAKANFQNLMSAGGFSSGADIVVTHNDPPATTIYQALSEGSKDTSHTLIYGFDGLKSTYDNYIKQGNITGTLIQDPASMAKWAVETLAKKIQGETVTFESKPIVPKNGIYGTIDTEGYGWINDAS